MFLPSDVVGAGDGVPVGTGSAGSDVLVETGAGVPVGTAVAGPIAAANRAVEGAVAPRCRPVRG